MTAPGDSSEPTRGVVARNWPGTGTAEARALYSGVGSMLSLVNLLLDLAMKHDYFMHVAEIPGERLNELHGTTPEKLATTAPGPTLRHIKANLQVLQQMIVARLMDEFSTYLVDLLRAVLRARPELLRSNEQVRVDHVLRFASMEELREDLIERKVQDLSYKGYADLEEWWSDRIGVPLVPSDKSRDALVLLLELRNAIVHNRGRAGARYLRTVNPTGVAIGEPIVISESYVNNALGFVIALVKDIDRAVAEKYKLPLQSWREHA
jgi:hypothetical protein